MFANANIRLIIDIAKELFYFFSHKCHASNQPRKGRIILNHSLSERRLEKHSLNNLAFLLQSRSYPFSVQKGHLGKFNGRHTDR